MGDTEKTAGCFLKAGMNNRAWLAEYAWYWTKLAPLLVWIGMILWTASRPKGFFFAPGVKSFYGVPRQLIQYAYHVSAFFILAVLFLRCFPSKSSREGVCKSEIVSLFGSALIAVLSELVQLYVPTRTPGVRDFGLDLFGSILAVIVMRLIRLLPHN
jgi:hypothetical protein